MNTLKENIHFYDYQPRPADFYSEVMAGLGKRPKSISPKFFYDEQGSRLFDAICELSEYYLTRTEMAILKEYGGEIAELIGEGSLLIEPGSGSSEKVKLLLEDVKPHAYMPMEISKEYLVKSAHKLIREFPWLDVHAACVDFTENLELPYSPDGIRKVAFFPGSTIGNFDRQYAVKLLTKIAQMVGKGGGLLIGVDLKKNKDLLNAAYDDAQGVTAAFNLNLLTRINRELDANFELDSFRHHAFYNEEQGRVELHLVSQRKQTIQVNSSWVEFHKGENIHTENSYKYTIEEFHALTQCAGFTPYRVWTDANNYFSVHYLTVT
jgi:dimethylhistidine N-methyltransferase